MVHANVITRVDPTSSINSEGTNESDREREREVQHNFSKRPPSRNNEINFTSHYGTIKHYFFPQNNADYFASGLSDTG